MKTRATDQPRRSAPRGSPVRFAALRWRAQSTRYFPCGRGYHLYWYCTCNPATQSVELLAFRFARPEGRMKRFLVLGSFCVLFAYAETNRLIVSNAASYQQNAGISPGAIITLKGDNLTNVTLTAPDPSHPPNRLGGVTVTINDIVCPIYYVSPTQVNAIVDPSTPPALTQAVLVSPTVVAQSVVTVEAVSSPAIFTLNGRGSS